MLTIVLLTPLIVDGVSLSIGEEHSFKIIDALTMIERGIAKAKDIKKYEEALKKVEEKKREIEERKIRAYAVLKQDKLKESAIHLADELKNTLELIEDKEFTTSFQLNRAIIDDIHKLSLRELRKKYKDMEDET